MMQAIAELPRGAGRHVVMMQATVELRRVETSGAKWLTGGYDADYCRVPTGGEKWCKVVDRWL